MDYPGDVPPTPAERASLRLAANAAWLARIKEKGDATPKAWAEKLMEQDNQAALAAAQKEIAAERKVHRCYICGRSNLPPWNRVFGVVAAVLLSGWAYLSDSGRDASFFGTVGLVALGAAIAGTLYRSIEPAKGEDEARQRFNEKPHG
jgi:hypothetical protein